MHVLLKRSPCVIYFILFTLALTPIWQKILHFSIFKPFLVFGFQFSILHTWILEYVKLCHCVWFIPLRRGVAFGRWTYILRRKNTYIPIERIASTTHDNPGSIYCIITCPVYRTDTREHLSWDNQYISPFLVTLVGWAVTELGLPVSAVMQVLGLVEETSAC